MNHCSTMHTSDVQWLADMFEGTHDAVMVQNPDGVILKANNAAAVLFGIEPEQLAGRRLNDLIPAECRDKWIHDFDKLQRNEWTFIEGLCLHSSLRQVPIEVSMIPSVCQNQPAVILHMRDISVYRNVERALLAAQEQWERSFDAITDYMCILDRSGKILLANKTMNDRFKPVHDELFGLDYRHLFGIDQNGKPEAAILDAVNQSPFMAQDVTFTRIDGWFSVSAFPLKNEHDKRIGCVLLVRDITEQHETKEALERSELMLRQSSKMEAIGRLAGGIAHDFNNILTSILGYSSLLMRTMKKNDSSREDVQEIVNAGERATALTRQLLNFSSDHAIETTVVNLNTVISGMEKFLRRTLGEDIELVTRLAPDLGLIKADISRMEQVIMNLSVNARDAMIKGGKLDIETVNVSLDETFCTGHSQLTPGNYILLEMSDSGHGMPPQVLEHIFEPFFTTKEKGKGTGIGLTTVYGIVRQFNGVITCYSEVNRGTVFKIYLPQTLVEGYPLPPSSSQVQGPMQRGTETILVVDDEQNIVSLVMHVLSDLGYTILTAKTGTEALQVSLQYPSPIHLILADIIMPELSGPELVEKIRPMRGDIKTLYMSGYACNAMVHNSMLRPDMAFIQKPFSFETLANRVRDVLDHHSEKKA